MEGQRAENGLLKNKEGGDEMPKRYKEARLMHKAKLTEMATKLGVSQPTLWCIFKKGDNNILLCTILSKILTSTLRRDGRRCENIPFFSKLLKNGIFLMFISSQTFSSIFLRQESHFTAAKIFRLYSVDNSSNSTHISNRFDLFETAHSIHISV